MNRKLRIWSASLFLLIGFVCSVSIWLTSQSATAQTSTGKAKPKIGTSKTKASDAKETRELEGRAEELIKNFVTETLKLAADNEKAGRFEAAQDQLRLVKQVKPDFPGLKEKIDDLSEQLFESNDMEIAYDVKDGWQAQVLVSKGKVVRIDGGNKEYLLQMNVKCDVRGMPANDARTDMVPGIRCGALMGIIVPLPEPGKPVNKNDKSTKIGDPFEIGGNKEVVPKEDGILLLNVNLPQGHKSTGKLLLKVAGHIKPLPKELR